MFTPSKKMLVSMFLELRQLSLGPRHVNHPMNQYATAIDKNLIIPSFDGKYAAYLAYEVIERNGAVAIEYSIMQLGVLKSFKEFLTYQRNLKNQAKANPKTLSLDTLKTVPLQPGHVIISYDQIKAIGEKSTDSLIRQAI
jgi:hypothetical protein